MIEVEATDGTIRAVDATKTSVTVRTSQWDPDAHAHSFSVDVDDVVSGYTSELRFPPALVEVDNADGERVTILGNEPGPLDLSPDEYLVHIENNVQAKLRFTGAATIEKPEYSEVVVRFPEPTAVSIGFKSRAEEPPTTITVPESPEGIAEAISVLPAAHTTVTPDRTFPTMRDHPPLIEFGETVDIPADVRDRRADTELTFELPRNLDYLFPAAPLSYYLGAEVALTSDARPRLTGGGVEYEFPEQPAFQQEVAGLLRRVFLLDSLARCAGPHGVDLAEFRHLDTLGLDAETLYERSIPERLNAYLAAPFERVSDDLPEWHLSISVEPIFEHVPSLSHHLHRLANIVLPKAEPLPKDERLSRSLDDFYRSAPDDIGEAVAVDLLKPELGPGRTHGWLADGAPIDVYKALPEAYEHRFDYRDRASEPFSFVAVLNDTGMASEHTQAAEIYEERAEELDIDITIHEGLSRRELAEVFESRNDMVHYIGHCERGGLRCPDGHLPLSTLEESNTQVFFLNACGSYYEGLELVRKGSVAGAVTFNEVLDEQAARVGTTFARLLVNGFSIERALNLSRRRIMMGKDYTVVGDGTHVLTQATTLLPAAAELDRIDDGTFSIRFEYSFPYINGGHFQIYVGDGNWRLFGNDPTVEVDDSKLRSLLDYADLPIIYDGDIYWPDELREHLGW